MHRLTEHKLAGITKFEAGEEAKKWTAKQIYEFLNKCMDDSEKEQEAKEQERLKLAKEAEKAKAISQGKKD